MNEAKQCKYSVEGMHCTACELFIERKLKENPNFKNVKANINNSTVSFEIENTEQLENEIEKINNDIQENGYKLSLTNTKHKTNFENLIKAFVISLGFILVYLILQKLGLSNILENFSNPYMFAIAYGMIASISSCMAVVGSVVLSISSSYSKGEEKVIPLTVFHTSRILSFFVFGGLLALIGQKLTINDLGYTIINLTIFIVMVLLGLSLLDISPFFNKFQLRIPKNIASNLLDFSKSLSALLFPFFLGLITFFLPCGFTQSMQIKVLTAGSFTNGALQMGLFTIGTLPVLATISFTSISFSNSKYKDIFFKTAGLLVIIMSSYSFYSFFYAYIISKYI